MHYDSFCKLRREIFSKILSSPVSDREKMRDESSRLLLSMLEARERENAFLPKGFSVMMNDL